MFPTLQCLVCKSSLQSFHLGTEIAVNKHKAIYIGECRGSMLANMSSFDNKQMKTYLQQSPKILIKGLCFTTVICESNS